MTIASAAIATPGGTIVREGTATRTSRRAGVAKRTHHSVPPAASSVTHGRAGAIRPRQHASACSLMALRVVGRSSARPGYATPAARVVLPHPALHAGALRTARLTTGAGEPRAPRTRLATPAAG